METGPYTKAWKRFKIVQWLIALLMILNLGASAVLHFFPAIELLIDGVLGITSLAAFGMVIWILRWKCPRCHQRFYRGKWKKGCASCGLPLWSTRGV